MTYILDTFLELLELLHNPSIIHFTFKKKKLILKEFTKLLL